MPISSTPRWFLTALFASAAFASVLHAQQGELLALKDRLDAATFRAISGLVDSASSSGLPPAPLISKVQEGLLKHASPATILTAARSLLSRLQESRLALGVSATADEIEAGASALRAGAVREQLLALRSARAGQAVTVPLVVLADLLSRGVPRDTAIRALEAMASAHATDEAFNALRSGIERDITGGMSPASAVSMRSHAMLRKQP